jgi:hypothetical protein
MPSDLRFPREAWLALAAGVAWLAAGGSAGWLALALCVLPGALLVASGVATLLALGEPRLRDLGALGGLLGVVFALPAWAAFGFGTGVALGVLSAGAFLGVGALTLRGAEPLEGVPQPPASLQLAAEVAVDQAVRGAMLITLPFPSASEHGRMLRELHEANALWAERGWLEKPVSYHGAPSAAERVVVTPRRAGGLDFEELRFESGYAPHDGEPGRERWLAYGPNRLAWAWLKRQHDPSAPWLICIHGYQMGRPLSDLFAFRAAQLHRAGLNLAFPILPFHGPRQVGALSGHGMFGPDFLDSAHALAQGMWDARRLIGWIRAQGGTRVGCYGLSLGGYSAALLASLAPELEAVVAGIPAADFPRLVFHHAPLAERARIERAGLSLALAEPVMRPVSPLALEPLVPHAGRFLFGAPNDQFVPADQVRDLWKHWGEPRIAWFPGAHITFGAHPEVAALVRTALPARGGA